MEHDDDFIRIRGARVHNLQNVDVDIPRNQMIVVTGPSGSGKSSLALDTLYAEGQRQYIESLSIYARQFFQQMERPDVDLIEGLQPTICIDQKSGSRNPRSTVATVTEIYDYLRLLMARVGQAHCYRCGDPISQQSPENIQKILMDLPESTKIMILAPLVRGKKGEHREIFLQIRKAGLVRVRVDGEIYDLDNLPELAPRKDHHLEAVVDRIIIRPGIESRLAESIDLAIQQSEGLVLVCHLDPEKADEQHPKGRWQDNLYSTQHACSRCEISFEELEPRTFSFNSPYGACQVCEGLGVHVRFDADLVIPDRSQSLAGGAVEPWKGLSPSQRKKRIDELDGFLAAAKISKETPLDELSPKDFDQFLQGDEKEFLGLLTLLEKEYATTTNKRSLEALESFRGPVTCQTCCGSRLRPEASHVLLGGKAVHHITALPISQAKIFFESLRFNKQEEPVAKPILHEINKRLEFLTKVGVDYLSLSRPAETLSGGEHQRVRLATGIGSGLVGVCYILDEPSVGLHPRDNQRLIDALRDLQEQGNTVLIVEHDEAMMRQADVLIDVGPGAGADGGKIVSQGTPDEVKNDPKSITGKYLSGEATIEIPRQRRCLTKSRSITIEGVTTNNLKNLKVQFPLQGLICVTGVSGSGKSSLVNETLTPALLRKLGIASTKPGPHTSLRGATQVDKVIQIDQSPIGRSPRSNAATYTGIFDEIRKVFAGTRLSKQQGYGIGRFSFNVKGGRCEDCQGQGVQKIEMKFLPDLYITCDTCGGSRFNRQTLQVRYRGCSIAEVLDMSVDELALFFENFPAIHRMAQCLQDVGLGYLPLGQPSTTISGGEAQRIKLATQLARVDTGSTLYLLDEPTTGLHFDDIKRLLQVLDKLVEKGNTVIVIEHNLDVIKCADWIIDIGPEGGAAGGEIVAVGTPEDIAEVEQSYTGRYLKPLLQSS